MRERDSTYHKIPDQVVLGSVHGTVRILQALRHEDVENSNRQADLHEYSLQELRRVIK